MRAHGLTAAALVMGSLACGEARELGEEVAGLKAEELVAPRAVACNTAVELAAERARHSLSEALAHWDRFAFDGGEAARAVQLARTALACAERAGLRDELREANARLLVWQRALYLRVQSARRAFSRARAAGRPAEAALHARELLALLDPDNAATAPLHAALTRWLRSHEAAHEEGST